MERSEEARASGLLHLVIGGQPVELPVLKIRAAREWRQRLDKAEVNDDVDDLDQPVVLMLDLLVAYDRMGVLGGRESLEDRATDLEVYAAFKEVLAATFPFVTSPEAMLAESFTRRVVVGLFLRESSTNGLSQSGGSTPIPSNGDLPRSSSSSSSTPAGSA